MSKRFLIIAMPALNEAATIGDVISRIPESIPCIDEIQVIVIDDGSDDETRFLLIKLAEKYDWVTLIHHPYNRGKGAAAHAGSACICVRISPIMSRHQSVDCAPGTAC